MMIKARHLESSCVVNEEGRASNLKEVLARGFPSVQKSEAHERKAAVVGSGPSVREFLDELRSFDGEVWAINGAYDYLVGQGIIPTGFFGMDPLPGLAQYVEGARSGTTFYLASICDPSVFDNLAGHKVVLWHPEAENMQDRYPKGSWIIGGGTHATTRAPFLLHLMGFRDITLYGVDSSFAEGPYCYEWGTYACDIDNPPVQVMINGEGPFVSEIGMLKQVAQLGVIHRNFNGVLKIRCGGLMDAFLRAPITDDSNIEVEKAA